MPAHDHKAGTAHPTAKPLGLAPFSAAAERNKGPILDILEALLPPVASVLEIASGTGQHAAHFATAHPQWSWQPSEADDSLLPGIAQRCAGLDNVRPPLGLDVLSHPWPLASSQFDAIYCANMLHICAWPTCLALMRGAASALVAGGRLVLYGPFLVDGEPTAASNLAFDADLRARNPDWGIRLLGEVVKEARAAGLAFERRFSMPANNLTVVFRSLADARRLAGLPQ